MGWVHSIAYSAITSTFLDHLTLKVAAANASEAATRIGKTVVGAVGGAIVGGEAGAAAGAIGALAADVFGSVDQLQQQLSAGKITKDEFDLALQRQTQYARLAGATAAMLTGREPGIAAASAERVSRGDQRIALLQLAEMARQQEAELSSTVQERSAEEPTNLREQELQSRSELSTSPHRISSEERSFISRQIHLSLPPGIMMAKDVLDAKVEAVLNALEKYGHGNLTQSLALIGKDLPDFQDVSLQRTAVPLMPLGMTMAEFMASQAARAAFQRGVHWLVTAVGIEVGIELSTHELIRDVFRHLRELGKIPPLTETWPQSSWARGQQQFAPADPEYLGPFTTETPSTPPMGPQMLPGFRDASDDIREFMQPGADNMPEVVGGESFSGPSGEPVIHAPWITPMPSPEPILALFKVKASSEELDQCSEKTRELIGYSDKYKSQLLEREGAPKYATALEAARIELQGGQIEKAKELGVKYDHVTKVKYAQNGLCHHIERLQEAFEGYESLKLNATEKKLLEQELSNASKLLDFTEQFVPRNK